VGVGSARAAGVAAMMSASNGKDAMIELERRVNGTAYFLEAAIKSISLLCKY
jgi:hypothetical protein